MMLSKYDEFMALLTFSSHYVLCFTILHYNLSLFRKVEKGTREF